MRVIQLKCKDVCKSLLLGWGAVRVCECVCQRVIIASRKAAETLLRREPVTLKSCAPRLPNNGPSGWNLTPPSLQLRSVVSGGESTTGRRKKPNSYTSSPPLLATSSSSSSIFLSRSRAAASRLTLICTSKPQQSLTFHPSADTNDLSRSDLTSIPTSAPPLQLPHPTSEMTGSVFSLFLFFSFFVLCNAKEVYSLTCATHAESQEGFFHSKRNKSMLYLWLRWGSMQFTYLTASHSIFIEPFSTWNDFFFCSYFREQKLGLLFWKRVMVCRHFCSSWGPYPDVSKRACV